MKFTTNTNIRSIYNIESQTQCESVLQILFKGGCEWYQGGTDMHYTDMAKCIVIDGGRAIGYMYDHYETPPHSITASSFIAKYGQHKPATRRSLK